MNRVALFFVAVLFVFGGSMALRYGYLRSLEPALEIVDTKSEIDLSHLKVGTEPRKEDERLPGILHDFELVERTGRKIKSKDYLGQVWVASFFFATCAHKCEQQNEHIAKLHDALREQGVKFVSITCDPKKDSPDRLTTYARKFTTETDSWVFLTGNMDYIQRIGAERFRMHVGEKSHSDVLIPIDKWGNIRGRFKWEDELESRRLKRTLDKLLAETEEPEELIKEKAREAEQVRKMQEQQKKREAEAAKKEAEAKKAANKGSKTKDAPPKQDSPKQDSPKQDSPKQDPGQDEPGKKDPGRKDFGNKGKASAAGKG